MIVAFNRKIWTHIKEKKITKTKVKYLGLLSLL